MKLKGITFNIIISFLITLICLTNVMPFNVLKADSQTDNFGKIALTSGVPQQIATKDNGDPYNVTVTGADSYMYGYYTYTDTARMSVLSLGNISLSPSSWNEVEHISVNDYSFYMTTYMSSISNYDPKYYIPDFPKYTENNLDIPNTGDYAFNFLGSQAYLGTTKYDANQSFYSWTVGNNPYTITCSTDVYVVAFSYSGTYIVYFFVQEPNATLTFTRASSNNVSPVYGSTTYKGVNLYYYTVSSWSYNPTNYTYGWNTNVFRNLNNRSTFPNPLHSAYNIYLYDTYEEPVPPVQYGDVVANFYTKYAGSGNTTDSQTWRENLDVIQWSNYDSLGQYINDYGLIEIRAVPGYFVGLSNASLLNQIYSDFVLDNELVSESYLLNPSDQEFTRKWGNMVNDWTVDIPFFSLTNYFRNDKWYKDGWIWQIRIVDIEDPDTPLTEWQTIYNTTSYSGNDIFNNPSLNTDTYDTIQEINNINNVTNNNTWYINNVPVGVDPNNNPQSDGSWIEVLIQAIADLIGTIVQGISDIIKAIVGIGTEIIEGIFTLITSLGVNILDVFTNLITWFQDLIGSIDLTGQNYLLPEEYTESLQTLSSWTNGVLGILFNSGFGLIVLVPFILFIVGLFL